jgi:phage shock protein C
MQKKLYRSRTNRMLAGVCAGIANYFNVDPTLIRILAVICLFVFNIASIIAYVILIIVVPLEGRADNQRQIQPPESRSP